MEITVQVQILRDGKVAHTFALGQTNEVREKDNGRHTMAHYQPAAGNQVIMPFSKLYVNVDAFILPKKGIAKAVKPSAKAVKADES